MKNRSVRCAVLLLAVLTAFAVRPVMVAAGGNRMGGTGLYLTQSAETLGPGELRFGAYGEYVRFLVNVDPENYDLAPQLAWSPLPNLELMAALPLRHHVGPDQKETGLGDGVLGLKYRLFPPFAAMGYVTLPSGDDSRGLGSGSTNIGVAGLLSLPLGAGVVTDINVGYQFSGVSGNENDDYLFYGLGLSVPLSQRLKLFGEITGRAGDQKFSHDAEQFALGLRFAASDRVTVTVGGGRGREAKWGPEDPELRLFAGVEMRFGGTTAGAGGAGTGAAPPPVVAAAPAPPPPPPPVSTAAARPDSGGTGAGGSGAGMKPAAAPTAPPPPPAPRESAATAPPPAAPPAKHTPQELEAAKKRISAATVLFEYDRTRLTPEGDRSLKKLAADLKEFTEINFTIEGHADNRGTSSYNKVLGLRRAEIVMRYLVKDGISFDRMKVVTQGEMKPKVANRDARSRALNRRVVFSALP